MSDRDALFASLYDELHRLAQAHVRRSAGPVTLSATTLLHEAYLNISERSPLAFPDRNRFLGYASRAMRGLVVDYVRQRKAQKRGGDLTVTSLQEADAPAAPVLDFDRLAGALDELGARQARRVVTALGSVLCHLVSAGVFRSSVSLSRPR